MESPCGRSSEFLQIARIKKIADVIMGGGGSLEQESWVAAEGKSEKTRVHRSGEGGNLPISRGRKKRLAENEGGNETRDFVRASLQYPEALCLVLGELINREDPGSPRRKLLARRL